MARGTSKITDPDLKLSEIIAARVTPSTKALVGVIAEEHGLSEAEWLRMIVERETYHTRVGRIEKQLIWENKMQLGALLQILDRRSRDSEHLGEIWKEIRGYADKEFADAIRTLETRKSFRRTLKS